jgi:hypothetical protein
MLLASSNIETISGRKRVSKLTSKDHIRVVSFYNNKNSYKSVLKTKQFTAKCYRFYFNKMVLCCTYDQMVYCSHNRIVQIGEAIKSRCKIHTISGLMHPTAIENIGRKSVCIDITIRSRSMATIVSGIYCYLKNGYLKQ